MDIKRFLDEVYIDEETSLLVAEDVRGNTHLLEFLTKAAEGEVQEEKIYLYAYSERNWPDIINFHAIECSLTGRPDPLKITVPAGKMFKVIRIVISQSTTDALGVLGIFIDSNLKLFLTTISELEERFEKPITAVENQVLEIKYRSPSKRTKIGVMVEGIYTDIDF